MRKFNKEKKADFAYVIGEVTCKVKYENSLIYIINTSLDATINGKRESMPSQTVSISNDGGINWQFMSFDEELTYPVIKEYFDIATADNVLMCIQNGY
jgi:hypothetical protein